MAATAELSVTLDPMGKSSRLEQLAQLELNFAEIVHGWSPFRIVPDGLSHQQ